MLVSGVQQSDSVIHIFLQIIFHYRLLPNIEYSSLCYRVNPCCLSILYRVVYISVNLILLVYLPLSLSPLITISLFSVSMHLFLFFKLESPHDPCHDDRCALEGILAFNLYFLSA